MIACGGTAGAKSTAAAGAVTAGVCTAFFSTRAESAWFRTMGWSVVNMTGYPEAVLAAEAGIPYAAVALVTDYDAGLDGVEPVTQEQVFTFFEQNVAKVRELLLVGIPRVAIR